MPRSRLWVAAAALAVLPLALVGKFASLQVVPGQEKGYEFLKRQAANNTVRTQSIPAYRGLITDRHGEPLAVSAPTVTFSVDPQLYTPDQQQLQKLAEALGQNPRSLGKRLALYRGEGKRYMKLARHLTPAEARPVLDLEIGAIESELEYRRFYPAGEVTAHLVGKTDYLDRGQSGLELAYDAQLRPEEGARRVLVDERGRIIDELELLRTEKSGANLALSIDLRLQYIAYRELKAAIARHQASRGSVVMLDARSGEVLAMVNQPSYNPNDRGSFDQQAARNRAIIDSVEPGSVMKPLTMVAALESGQFQADSVIDTAPGQIRVGGKTFVDHSNYRELDLGGILAKSSQVGTTKVAMALEPEAIRSTFVRAGLGDSPGTGFPGEATGKLPARSRWHPVEHATLAFGYGILASPLQLAQAYGVLANDGLRRPLSLLRLSPELSASLPPAEQVMNPDIVASVRRMMTRITKPGGTATRAAIPYYSVAGKTGTTHKAEDGSYLDDRYVALFAGMAPAASPRLVTVVVIDDPRGKDYFGGAVAAPVFSRVTSEALRLLGVPPTERQELAQGSGIGVAEVGG